MTFLVAPQRYFPIRSTRFDKLLKLYGIPGKIAGYVSWSRYQILLDLAEELKNKLSNYGPIDAIAIQSYMWVLSYLIDPDSIEISEYSNAINYEEELSKRKNATIERERIGLQGEQFIFEREVEQLKCAGKSELATRVRLVAIEDVTLGYDILSYTPDAEERHIEVKTTTRSPSNDNGFWISNNEKEIAARDSKWMIYRVWDIDTTPRYQNLGNLVQQTNAEWELVPATWYVRPNSLGNRSSRSSFARPMSGVASETTITS
ncbi:MAG: DUF3883 domain-containing protein [Anaerolineae bacterium]|nr:DUF3883 domain-containing protein [Anaerolineae bacterium]